MTDKHAQTIGSEVVKLWTQTLVLLTQLWCAAGVDLTGWKTSNQEAVKTSNGSDPLTGEDEGGDGKSEQSSPEKKKVNGFNKNTRINANVMFSTMIIINGHQIILLE